MTPFSSSTLEVSGRWGCWDVRGPEAPLQDGGPFQGRRFGPGLPGPNNILGWRGRTCGGEGHFCQDRQMGAFDLPQRGNPRTSSFFFQHSTVTQSYCISPGSRWSSCVATVCVSVCVCVSHLCGPNTETLGPVCRWLGGFVPIHELLRSQ